METSEMSGSLQMVSIGPGFVEHVTAAAEAALKNADTVVAYDLYLTWIRPWLNGKEIITYPLTEEKARALAAIEAARAGKRAVIISSGDIGVYGMASLVFEELADTDNFDVSAIPGVTSATACASLLGAPLAHDFMTLSLSDLLCPWEWIEDRARRAAQADLCMALYNVRSKKRPDGVYRILDVIAEHKSASTMCGVVRNAYRPEQSVSTMTLSELRAHQFDMLTTIIIGNRFTRTNRGFLFTPRGYNNWSPVNEPAQDPVPNNAIWVFSGTSDGNDIANALCDSGHAVVVSAATAYGAEVATRSCPGATVVFGKKGAEARTDALSKSKALAVVDATHPFAAKMSNQLIEITSDLHIPYLRFERPHQPSRADATCGTIGEALSHALKIGKRIFLACGSKILSDFNWSALPDDTEVFVRITPDPDSLAKAIGAGLPASNIVAMQGPFSKELNMAMWRQHEIDVVITKESGAAGGYPEKVEAARELGIPILTVERPSITYPRTSTTYEEVLEFAGKLGALV